MFYKGDSDFPPCNVTVPLVMVFAPCKLRAVLTRGETNYKGGNVFPLLIIFVYKGEMETNDLRNNTSK